MDAEPPPPAERLASASALRPRRELLIGLTCGCGVVPWFSGFTLVSRLGMRSVLAPSDLAAIRFGIGGLLLFPLFARFGLSGPTSQCRPCSRAC